MSGSTSFSKKKNISALIILGVMALAIPYLLVNVSIYVGYIIIVALIGVPVMLLIVKDYGYSIYIVFIWASSLFFISRLIDVKGIPLGIFFDVLIIWGFLIMLFQLKKNEFQWKLNDPVTITYLLFYLYFAFELVNPSASIQAWLISSRSYMLVLLFYIFIHYFTDKQKIKTFVNFVMVAVLLIALYGLYQEYVGLSDFEWTWLRSKPERYQLYFIWGRMRKFSILSDPSAYGLFLAFGVMASLALAFGPYKPKKKVFYGIICLLSIWAMSFSGTRTAYAMIAVGVVLFIFLNLHNPKILAGSFIIVIGFFAVLFGPFYAAPIQRLRSTFNLSEDASMSVRDTKRIRFQDYIQTHPMGGGVSTAGTVGLQYAPGHPLAGDYDPDSGYLRIGLEFGWVGLLLFFAFNSAVVITGIQNAYNLKDPLLRTYNLAFMIPFFGLSVAHYTQDAILQKPVNVWVIAAYALMVKLKDIKD